MATDPAARAGAILEIDLAGITENWRLLARQAAPALCAAVVKANAYGLGAVPVARALAAAGCRMFFVATLDEGIALRHALGESPEIAVFNGPFPGAATEFVAHGLVPVLNDSGQIEEWARPERGRPARMRLGRPRSAREFWRGPPAILHIDTGMSR